MSNTADLTNTIAELKKENKELRKGIFELTVKVRWFEEQGIVFVEIIESDLNLDNMLASIPDILPLRPIDKNSTYIRGLTRLSEEYITNCMTMRLKEQRSESV
jgi:hypothetical protein